MGVDTSTLQTALLSAIFLTQAATFLVRANEIDLSLDAQCFFVATLQACLFLYLSPFMAFAVSCVVLTVIQTSKLGFNRITSTDPLINSIAAALIYVGCAYLLRDKVYPGGGEPQYQRWLTLDVFCYLAIGVSLFIVVCDVFLGVFHRTRFVLTPFGGVPRFAPSATWSVLPATILTCLAATLLGLHAGFVTEAFSSGLGILAAAASILCYGRLGRATGVGVVLGLVYLFGIASAPYNNAGQLASWMPSSMVSTLSGFFEMQSLLVPILTFFALGAIATFWDRP